MKTTISLCVFFLAVFGLNAQGTLQFNQAKIITDTQQTVPAGKVWKVSAIYGQEQRTSNCVDFSTTSVHEVGTRARCGGGFPTTMSGVFDYAIRSIVVNGTIIPLSISGFPACPPNNIRNTATCSGGSSYDCTYFQNTNFSCVNMATDPNVLPIWIPAGTTLKTGGPKTFASVIEFNIIP